MDQEGPVVKHAEVIGRKEVSSVMIQPLQSPSLDLHSGHKEDEATPGSGTPVLSASCPIHQRQAHTDCGYHCGPQQNQGNPPESIDFHQRRVVGHFANAKAAPGRGSRGQERVSRAFQVPSFRFQVSLLSIASRSAGCRARFPRVPATILPWQPNFTS
jgi:hypothetical protein